MAARNRKLLNLTMLIGGFGIGQGSIFVAQTFLVAEGRLDLLATFGLHFSFAILGILLVDWGSLTVLARETATAIAEGGDRAHVWRAWWAMVPSRLLVALLVVGAGLAYALTSEDPFGRAFVLAALPSALIWAFNATGILDGLKLSGISGVTGSLPYLGVASALFLTRDWSEGSAGLVTGAALTGAYALTIAAQQVATAAAGKRVTFTRPTRRQIGTAAQQGFSSCLSLLPGQLYFRFQLGLSATVLGTEATAVLVYAKQIVSGVAQLIGFLRRIEFPALVESLKGPVDNIVLHILRKQTLGTTVSLAAAVIILPTSLVVAASMPGDGHMAWTTVAAYTPVIISGTLGLCLQQGLFAVGRFHSAATLRLTMTVVALALSSALVSILGLYGFILADVSADIAFAFVSMVILHRYNRIKRQTAQA